MAFKILSLDGGGAWAMLQAIALREIYGNIAGRQILAKFDIATANSGGSIVLAGLIENKTPSEIIELFGDQDNREAIFAKTSFIENLLSHIPIFPKYSTAGKLKGLTKIFGATGAQPIASLTGASWIQGPSGQDVKILIVAMDYDSARATFFRSYSTSHGANADNIPLVQAVHASSDAPVEFFDAPTEWNGRRYWDGAMAGLNNPLMAALVDMVGNGVSPSDMVGLSIGTGTVKLVPAQVDPYVPAEFAQPKAKPGPLVDLAKAAGCVTDDPPDTATFSAHVILSASRKGGDPTVVGPVVRLSPVIRPILENAAWRVPDYLDLQQFKSLTELGMDAVEQDQAHLIEALGASWVRDGARNQPIRVSSSNWSNPLGEELFSEAKARWLALP